MQVCLSSTRLIERVIYKGTLLNDDIKATFPPLSPMEEAILEMESEAQNYSYAIFCTPYVRMRKDGSWFVDIYLRYDENNLEPFGKKELNKNILTRRLIIASGYMMTEEDESILMCLHSATWIEYNQRVTGDFVADLDMVAPELHMKRYKSLDEAFMHAYYASFASGLREILYKCNLDEIARHLDMICGYDIIASNAEKAFGLPMKLLRKLNHFDAIEKVLCNEDTRDLAKKVYGIKHTILNDVDRLNIYQIKYLLSVINGEQNQDKVVLRALGTLEEGWDSEVDEFIYGDELYEKYLDYVRLVNLLGKNSHFPKYINLKIENSDRFYASYQLLERCIEDDSSVSRMKELSKEWKQKYSFEGDQYKIVIPETLAEFLDESSQQHNCLYNMIDDNILGGNSIVLFMRDKKDIAKSLVTIEIRDNEIKQARRDCNASYTSSDKKFLMDFAKATGVTPGILVKPYSGYMHIPMMLTIDHLV